MTKSDLVEKLAEKAANLTLTKKQCEEIVDTVFDRMKDALRKGEKIEIRGFGSFTIRVRRSKEGRNPKTGEKVFIPEKRIPFFKVGKELREMVNMDEKKA
jgi:integration host factor subunit beta